MPRFAFGLIAALITSSCALAAPQYEVTNLTEAFYADYNDPVAIEGIEITSMNDSGQFVGKLSLAGGVKDIFVWEIGFQPVLAGINLTNGYFPSSSEITNSGCVTGTIKYSDTQEMQVYSWNTTSNSLEYWTDTSKSLRIIDMNEHGSVAAIKNIEETDAAVAFGGNINQAAAVNLMTYGLVQDVPYSHSAAINNDDILVGNFGVEGQEPDSYHQAFMWSQDGGRKDLGSFIAEDINNTGQVIGWATKILGITDLGNNFAYKVQYYSVLWEDGELYEIETLGEKHTYLEHLNDLGQAVGYAPGGGSKAIYWDKENGLLNINDLIAGETLWNFCYTNGINNNGCILAKGNLAGELSHTDMDPSFLLTPTNAPEPGGLVLFLGLLIFASRLFSGKAKVNKYSRLAKRTVHRLGYTDNGHPSHAGRGGFSALGRTVRGLLLDSCASSGHSRDCRHP